MSGVEHSTKSQRCVRQHELSVALKFFLHTFIGVEADLVYAGLFFHLAQQLHETPTIKS